MLKRDHPKFKGNWISATGASKSECRETHRVKAFRRLRKEVWCRTSSRSIHAQQRSPEIQRQLNPEITLYGPVRRLSAMLFLSAASAIIASICQLTIGLIEQWIATFFCIFIATFAISILLAALWLIKSALSDWLDGLEDHNNKQNKIKSAKSSQ